MNAMNVCVLIDGIADEVLEKLHVRVLDKLVIEDEAWARVIRLQNEALQEPDVRILDARGGDGDAGGELGDGHLIRDDRILDDPTLDDCKLLQVDELHQLARKVHLAYLIDQSNVIKLCNIVKKTKTFRTSI